ncbi:MAG: fatty acid desaturase [Elainellaceae cyanobacterium]
MTMPVQKADFTLQPYMKSNNLRATVQILNTVVPYIALWILAVKAAPVAPWLLPPVMVLMVLFSTRCFSLMHDCGHYSLFTAKKANRAVGFALGVLNAIPQYPWSRGHAFHHKTNGDWERYRGPSALISTNDFEQLPPSAQWRYAAIRHPLMLLPGGFFYLAIKPRVALIAGTIGFISHSLDCLKKGTKTSLPQIVSSYQSKHWYTAAEFWDLLFNNICVVGSWVLLCHYIGTALFLSLYAVVLAFSAAVFIYLFFIQHNFEGSYAHRTDGWSYVRGAIEGSSYLKMSAVLEWFTASIGYHNIHHLSERIPNYNLKACHQANSHLLTGVKILQIKDMPACAKFILWDRDANRLVSIQDHRRNTQLNAVAIGQ